MLENLLEKIIFGTLLLKIVAFILILCLLITLIAYFMRNENRTTLSFIYSLLVEMISIPINWIKEKIKRLF